VCIRTCHLTCVRACDCLQVRGVLNKEEVAMAKGTDYLRGVHVIVATPTALLDCIGGKDAM